MVVAWEREWEYLPSAGLCSKCLQPLELHLVSHKGGQNPSIWGIIHCLPGVLVWSWIRSVTYGALWNILVWDVGVPSIGLICWATVPAHRSANVTSWKSDHLENRTSIQITFCNSFYPVCSNHFLHTWACFGHSEAHMYMQMSEQDCLLWPIRSRWRCKCEGKWDRNAKNNYVWECMDSF